MTYEDVVSSSPVVLVEFYATWCPHCRRMMPVMEQLKNVVAGKAEIVQLDIEQNPETTQENDIQGTPTFLLYKNGTLIWRQSGEMPEAELLDVINQALSS